MESLKIDAKSEVIRAVRKRALRGCSILRPVQIVQFRRLQGPRIDQAVPVLLDQRQCALKGNGVAPPGRGGRSDAGRALDARYTRANGRVTAQEIQEQKTRFIQILKSPETGAYLIVPAREI
jgi:hypothetical protein